VWEEKELGVLKVGVEVSLFTHLHKVVERQGFQIIPLMEGDYRINEYRCPMVRRLGGPQRNE
jgi:hypothetical protein